MKIIKILESIKIKSTADHAQKIDRLRFWVNEFRDTEFALKVINEETLCHIVLVKRRKTRSDSGKERVNRTGFGRGMNPFPRNLDKLPKFNKKD